MVFCTVPPSWFKRANRSVMRSNRQRIKMDWLNPNSKWNVVSMDHSSTDTTYTKVQLLCRFQINRHGTAVVISARPTTGAAAVVARVSTAITIQ